MHRGQRRLTISTRKQNQSQDEMHSIVSRANFKSPSRRRFRLRQVPAPQLQPRQILPGARVQRVNRERSSQVWCAPRLTLGRA
jgi:hypothetical protein